jgi:hypothetical protein
MKFRLGWHSNYQSSQDALAPRQTNTQKSSNSLTALAGGVCTLLVSLSCLFSGSASAAERVTLRVGLLERSVEIEELETFAQTGDVPPQLKPLEFLLTPDVKQVFRRRLHVDSFLVEPFLADLFNSDDGEKLLEQLSQALPGSDANQIEETFGLALHQPNALSFLSFVRAYPHENLVIDLAEVGKIAIQLNASAWQNQLISSRLEKDLQTNPNENLPLNFNPAAPGDEIVSTVTLKLRDPRRERTVPVDIYFSANTRGPLVVISHGFAADRKFLKYLARHLASHG